MFPQRYPNRGISNLIDAAIVAVSLGFVIACAMAGCSTLSHAQETAALDLSILQRLDAPTAAPTTVGDRLDLSILDRLDTPAATGPVESLDLMLLDDLDTKPGRPAVKPSREALRSLGTASGVDLGDEIGREACRPTQPQASLEIDYPTRESNWTYPGVGRSALIQHLTTAPQHRGKFDLDTLARLETNELQALHSDDHEGRKKSVAIAEAPRQSAATCPNGACPVPASTGKQAGMTPTTGTASPPSWGNVTSFGWTDGTWRSSPQPGANYPTLGGVLIPLGSTPAASQPVSSGRVYFRGPCPGGVCPVR